MKGVFWKDDTTFFIFNIFCYFLLGGYALKFHGEQRNKSKSNQKYQNLTPIVLIQMYDLKRLNKGKHIIHPMYLFNVFPFCPVNRWNPRIPSLPGTSSGTGQSAVAAGALSSPEKSGHYGVVCLKGQVGVLDQDVQTNTE